MEQHDTPAVAGQPAGREAVIEATTRAAVDLFATRNPGQVSVREIAAAAGVSHALVHRYMGSKEDIFFAALDLARTEAAEYWVREGMAGAYNTFDADLPPGRYAFLVMRAALDGIQIPPSDLKLPRSDTMLGVLEADELPVEQNTDNDFDVRLVFSAVAAMAVGIACAEDLFLVQSGLENADRAVVHAELNRLFRRVLALGDPQVRLD